MDPPLILTSKQKCVYYTPVLRKIAWGTIGWGLLAAAVLTFFFGLGWLQFIGLDPRPTPRPRVAVQRVLDADFKSAAVTGEPKEDAQGNIIEQPVAVIVGVERDDPNSALAKECWATVFVRWDEQGNITLTLESRSKVTQPDTTNADALTLDDYKRCNTP